jgi:hypothetical protein
MNIRHAYSKEDPSPDERLLWGALVDDVDALALLRIGYSEGANGAPSQRAAVFDAFTEGFDQGYNAALNEDAA